MDMNELNKFLDCKNAFDSAQLKIGGEAKEIYLEYFKAGTQHQQAKVEELQRRNQMLNDNIKEQGQKLVYQNEVIETQAEKLLGLRDEKAELQKRVEGLERKLQIKTRHCEFYEQSRKGHRSLAIHRKKQINSALEQIEKLYSRAESDYQKDRNPYYDGMLSALDLAEQAIRGELEEQALKGEG